MVRCIDSHIFVNIVFIIVNYPYLLVGSVKVNFLV